MLFCSCFSRSCSLGREMFVLPSLTSSNPRGRSFTITHDSERAIFQILIGLFVLYRFVMYPYTVERRDVLGNTSPEVLLISRGRGFCTPRPERGQSYTAQSIVNVICARRCAWYLPKGVYQGILSLGHYFPIHSLGCREWIMKLWKCDPYRPCH